MPTTYKDSTYKEVLCWTANTKIKYRPNPKSGKSFIRYAKYERSKTPAEAMANGSFAQDLFFDYEHGHITVVGGEKRKHPLNPDDETEDWSKLDKMLARMHRSWKTWSNTFEVAKSLGVDRRQLTSGKQDGETAGMRAGRLAANEMAKMILKAAATEQRKIDDDDVVAVLQLWGFKNNVSRQNVMKEGVKVVFSDTLGCVASYDGAVLVTAATSEYPAFAKVLCRRLSDHMPKEFKEHSFGWTSINVNANYAGRLHRDANNEGPSFIKAFGNFTGGQLNYWGDDKKDEGTVESCCALKDKITFDISKQLLLFDGNRGHSVENFKGDRYSLVYFCTGQFFKANKTVRGELERCGFHFPTKEGLKIAKDLLGKPRGYKALRNTTAAAAGSSKPMAITWPQKAHKKHKLNFLSKEMQHKAKLAVKDLTQTVDTWQASAKECTDTKFTGYKVCYETLPDKRRRCNIFMIGVSGGRRLAVSGDEEEVGAGRYAYKKVEEFPCGPGIESSRLSEVREWCEKLGAKSDPRAGRKRVIRSYANKVGGEKRELLKRRMPASASSAPGKRARAAGA
mmetsp:Transcript_26663/g.69669  ORF Transcript_26663/g.69669 Transcript_26663/m.69669 type:complete len:566 (+) Transcript_26663:114-1811(+)